MKCLELTILSTLLLTALSGFTAVHGQEPSEAELMKKWEEFKTPGPEHKQLEYKLGEWNIKTVMWMAPGAPPAQSTGKATFEMIMDGRFLIDRTRGTFNGMPFEGRGMTGFNNHTLQFESHWVDNFGTGFMIGNGSFNAEKKEWHFKFRTIDPMTGKMVHSRSIEKIVNDNTWVMTMFNSLPDGGEFKTLEITYNRAK